MPSLFKTFWEASDMCPFPFYAIICYLSNLLCKIKRELPSRAFVAVNDVKSTSLLLSPYKKLRGNLQIRTLLRMRVEEDEGPSYSLYRDSIVS